MSCNINVVDLDVLYLLAAVNFKILKKTDETVLHANLFYSHNLTSQPVCALVLHTNMMSLCWNSKHGD